MARPRFEAWLPAATLPVRVAAAVPSLLCASNHGRLLARFALVRDVLPRGPAAQLAEGQETTVVRVHFSEIREKRLLLVRGAPQLAAQRDKLLRIQPPVAVSVRGIQHRRQTGPHHHRSATPVHSAGCRTAVESAVGSKFGRLCPNQG
jgi:hypothetical protein